VAGRYLCELVWRAAETTAALRADTETADLLRGRWGLVAPVV